MTLDRDQAPLSVGEDFGAGPAGRLLLGRLLLTARPAKFPAKLFDRLLVFTGTPDVMSRLLHGWLLRRSFARLFTPGRGKLQARA
jgi:hypothetical protein